MDLEKLKEFLNTEEGLEDVREYFANIDRIVLMHNSQLERFHKNYSDRFEEIVDKVVAKYESDEYVMREYSMGLEPREDLYYFLLDYAREHGKDVTNSDPIGLFNDFTDSIYYHRGYYFHVMIGVGVAKIKIVKLA